MAQSNNITGKTFHSIIWVISGTGIQSILNLLVLSILARLITPAEYGLLGVAMLFIGFANIFAQLGVGYAIIQLPNLDNRHFRLGFSLSILIGIMFWAILSLSAQSFAQFMRMPDLQIILYVLATLYLIKGPVVVAQSLLARELRFQAIAIINTLAYFIGFVLVGITLAAYGFGIWALIAAHLTQAAVSTIGSLYARPHAKKPLWDRATFEELMYLGGGDISIRIGTHIALRGDYFVVGRWIGDTPLGLYTRAYQLMLMPTQVFIQAVFRVLLSSLSRIQDDKQKIRLLFQRGVNLMAIVMLPLGAIMALLAPEIILIILGAEWANAIQPFQILAMGSLFRNGYKINDTIARAAGQAYQLARMKWIYAFMIITMALIGQNWGLNGVAYGVLIAIILHYLAMNQLTLYWLDMRWREWAKLHIHGATLTVFLIGLAWPVIIILRSFSLPHLLTLTITLLSISIAGIIFICYAPKRFIGNEVGWLLTVLTSYLPEKYKNHRLLSMLISRLS